MEKQETLENNDFMILNNIIYNIHTNPEFSTLQREVLEQMQQVVEFDSADFSLADGEGSGKLCQQVSLNCKGNFSKEFESLDYSQGILTSGKSMVYRETDILSESKRVETEYYKKVYEANHWHHALQIILGYQQEFVGVLTLYKLKGKEDFNYTDILLMDLLKEHLAYRLHQEKEKKQWSSGKLSLEEVTERYSLTPREQEILGLMVQGKENEEICNLTFIANNTLKKHILNIYKKLQVNSRIQLFKIVQHLE